MAESMDLGPADLALPAAIARAPRLNPADWQLRELSITQPTWEADPGHGFGGFLEQVTDGLPILEATLLPLTPAAFQSVDELSGQCFFFASHLFRISHGSVTISADRGRTEVWISARAIWRQKPECDSRKELPAPFLP